MRHLVIERWSQGDSFAHRIDPRAKLVVTLGVLAWIGTSSAPPVRLVTGYGVLLAAGCLSARLPVMGVLMRAASVMAFTAVFALVAWVGGDSVRAAMLLTKSALSSLAIILLAGTTPFSGTLLAMESLGAPRLLVQVIQFVHRYLFLLIDKAIQVRRAASCRGGFRFEAAGGAVAALFGSAYGRAERIHRAMLARGPAGHLVWLRKPRATASDWAFGAAVTGYLVGARLAWGL